MHILIVEDDPIQVRWTSSVLTEAGYLVQSADNIEDGLRLGSAGGYDLALVGVRLPARNGVSVVRGLRQAGQTMPIIVMAGGATDEDVVRGLDAGADAYLVKPVSRDVLLARVRAALRRGAASRNDYITVGEFTLDRRGHHITCGGKELALTPREFSLMEHFMRRPEEVVSRSELLSKVWRMNFDPRSNVIDATMNRLRTKLENAACSTHLLTVRGVGFVLSGVSAESDIPHG